MYSHAHVVILANLDFILTRKNPKFAHFRLKTCLNNFHIKISYINGMKIVGKLALIFALNVIILCSKFCCTFVVFLPTLARSEGRVKSYKGSTTLDGQLRMKVRTSSLLAQGKMLEVLSRRKEIMVTWVS